MIVVVVDGEVKPAVPPLVGAHSCLSCSMWAKVKESSAICVFPPSRLANDVLGSEMKSIRIRSIFGRPVTCWSNATASMEEPSSHLASLKGPAPTNSCDQYGCP